MKFTVFHHAFDDKFFVLAPVKIVEVAIPENYFSDIGLPVINRPVFLVNGIYAILQLDKRKCSFLKTIFIL